MKEYAPDYFVDFKCIADKCRHSCCIGWDVYVDEDTAELYEGIEDDFGCEIKDSLGFDVDGVYFKMTSGGRCPFLDEKGLCRIILRYGEGYLCDICREHPRFYNSFSDRYEVGLGLSCEEAARIILSQKGITELVMLSDDGIDGELTRDECEAISRRNKVFEIIQDRSRGLDERIANLLMHFKINPVFPTAKSIREKLTSLERLDESRDAALDLMAICDGDICGFDLPFEKLLLYFVYRHASTPCDADEFSARIKFSVLSMMVIRWLCIGMKNKNGCCTFDELCDFARMYSSEIEYSEENTEELIDLFR